MLSSLYLKTTREETFSGTAQHFVVVFMQEVSMRMTSTKQVIDSITERIEDNIEYRKGIPREIKREDYRESSEFSRGFQKTQNTRSIIANWDETKRIMKDTEMLMNGLKKGVQKLELVQKNVLRIVKKHIFFCFLSENRIK